MTEEAADAVKDEIVLIEGTDPEAEDWQRQISIEYDPSCKLVQVVQCGEEVFDTIHSIEPEEWEKIVQAFEGRPLHLGDRVATACLHFAADADAYARGVAAFIKAAKHEMDTEEFDLVLVAVPQGSGSRAAEKLSELLGFGGLNAVH